MRQRALNGDEPVAFVGPVVSGFLRVVTNRRIFLRPTPLEVADRDFARFTGLRWRRPFDG
jgi:hypothetical protein